MYLSLESSSPSPLFLFVNSFPCSDSSSFSFFFPSTLFSTVGISSAEFISLHLHEIGACLRQTRSTGMPEQGTTSSECDLTRWSVTLVTHCQSGFPLRQRQEAKRERRKSKSFHCNRQIKSKDNDCNKLNECTLLTLNDCQWGDDLETK